MIGVRSLKRWMRRRIEGIVAEAIAAESLDAPAFRQYVPYRPGDRAFVFPRRPTVATQEHRGLPLPPTSMYAGYGPTPEVYIELAERHVATMRDLLAKSGLTLKPGARILDHGCAAGRMIRCLVDLADSCEIWGTDITAEHIYWCQQHLSPPFHFATTTMVPHLPFEDRSFTLIYCGSVFTHIDDLAAAWLLELHRILAPDGRAYITIHDDNTLELLRGKHANSPFAAVVRARGYENADRDEFGMLVFDRSRQWWLQTFYDVDYFCDRLLAPMFRVLSVTPAAYGYQTAIIVERR